jgi:hypothetical protein
MSDIFSPEGIYLYDNYIELYSKLSDENKEIFLHRSQKVENLLKIESEVLPPESFQGTQDSPPEDKIKLKLQKEIGKYLLSDLLGFNRMKDEEIVKIFQFEVEILLSLKELINCNHYDILMLEDLLFISRMIDLSINLDSTLISGNIVELINFMEDAQENNPGPKLSKDEISEYVDELILNFKKHTELSINSEFDERVNAANEVAKKLYQEDSKDYADLIEASSQANKTLRAIYENALGYNHVYGIPLRILKNVLLMINVNLLKANLDHGISSSEEANLFSNN